MPVEKSDDNDKNVENLEEEECAATFKPVVTLPIVQIKTYEEEEEPLLKLRAKLYRYGFDAEEPEWKERGTGELKILKNVKNKTIRIVMRRDKTLKVCANHFIQSNYDLKPVKGSQKAFIYTTHADYSDETPKSECLAVRFVNIENANQFKEIFNESKIYVQDSFENEDEKCVDLSCNMDNLNLTNNEITATE